MPFTCYKIADRGEGWGYSGSRTLSITRQITDKCPKIFKEDNTESWPARAKFVKKPRKLRFILSRFTSRDSREISQNDSLNNSSSS